jgi:signal transduction histidine kinase
MRLASTARSGSSRFTQKGDQNLLLESDPCETRRFTAKGNVKSRQAESPRTEAAPLRAGQAVIPVDREPLSGQRPSKLSKTNTALQQNLQALAEDSDLNRFLGHLLVQMAHQFETNSSAVFVIERPDRRLLPHLIYENRHLIRGKDSDHPILKNPRMFAANEPVWLTFCRGQPVIRRNPQSDTTLGWTEAHRDYYTKKGITGILNVPLAFGGEVVGTLAIQFCDHRTIDQEAVELAQTLGLHATLAFQLTTMAEQSTQIAIAKEQAEFARQRAAELGKANEALRGCLDALASVPELDEFLGQVMGAMTRQLGAASSVLRLRNFEQDVLTLDLVFQDGRAMTPGEAKYPLDLQTIPVDERQLALLKKPVTVLRLLDTATGLPEKFRSYLLGLGVKTSLVIPLGFAGKLVGSVTFRFTEDREFRPEELEIARAQASLAIQLTRLAKGARRSAVLGERNRMAGEIHDSLAQSFVGISMHLDATEAAPSKAKSLPHIRRANELARFGLAEARRSVLSLRAGIQRGGRAKAIQQLVERSNVPGILRCDLQLEDIPDERLPSQVQHELFRICQEAKSNAVRHARSTVITTSLRWNAPDLTLQISDNGSGMCASRLEQTAGFGMANICVRGPRSLGQSCRSRPAQGAEPASL